MAELEFHWSLTQMVLAVIFQVPFFLPVLPVASLLRFHSGADAAPPEGNLRWPPLMRLLFREGDRTEPSSSVKKRP
jgi:hypothetical protein